MLFGDAGSSSVVAAPGKGGDAATSGTTAASPSPRTGRTVPVENR